MLACMHGQVRQNSQLNKTMQQKYGVSLEEPAELFGVWLGGQLQKTEVVDQADFGKRWGITLYIISPAFWNPTAGSC